MTDKLKVSSVLILIYFNLVFTLKDETPIRGEFYIAKLRLLSLRCKVHQPEIAKINYCRLRSYSRNFQTLNINADLLKDLYNPVDVSIAVYYKFLTIFREVYRIKFNYCSLWIGNTTEFSSKNPLIDFIYKLVEESIPSAVKHGCPFKKGVRSLLKFMSFIEKFLFPSEIHLGEHKLFFG